MGEFVQYICPECDYSFGADLGAGFGFPGLYQETIRKIKAGRYGKAAKEFFRAHPDGAVDCIWELFKCSRCHRYYNKQDLSMYVPKEDGQSPVHNEPWCVEIPQTDIPYVTRHDLDRAYTLFEKYDHRCTNCGGSLEFVASDAEGERLKEAICPVCGEKMVMIEWRLWD